MSPVRRTCVPPHSSTDQPMALPLPSPMATTRTSSPYFSPNSARAPDAIASSTAISRVVTGEFCSTMSLAISSTSLELGRADRLGMREIEAQPVGRHQRALLRDVIAEHLAQRLVQQMRRRMVLRGSRRDAHDRPSSATGTPTLSVPSSTAPACTNRSPAFFSVSVTWKRTPSALIVPVSPTWPPDSP